MNCVSIRTLSEDIGNVIVPVLAKSSIKQHLSFSSTVRNYTRLEEIRDDLLTGEVKGALIDTYVAAARTDLFDHESLSIHEVIGNVSHSEIKKKKSQQQH